MSVRPFVRPSIRLSAQNNSASTGRIFMKFYIWVFLEKLSRKFKFHSNLTTMKVTLHQDQYSYLIISSFSSSRMKNVSHRLVEKIKTRVLCSITFFFPENSAVSEIMGNNILEQGRSQMIIRCMRIECWITKATNTHFEYVMLIAFPLQQ